MTAPFIDEATPSDNYESQEQRETLSLLSNDHRHPRH